MNVVDIGQVLLFLNLQSDFKIFIDDKQRQIYFFIAIKSIIAFKKY